MYGVYIESYYVLKVKINYHIGWPGKIFTLLYNWKWEVELFLGPPEKFSRNVRQSPATRDRGIRSVSANIGEISPIFSPWQTYKLSLRAGQVQ